MSNLVQLIKSKREESYKYLINKLNSEISKIEKDEKLIENFIKSGLTIVIETRSGIVTELLFDNNINDDDDTNFSLIESSAIIQIKKEFPD